MRIKIGIAPAAAAAALVLAQASGSAFQEPGRATGSLTVGDSTFRLSHAYAFPDKPDADATKATWRVMVTDKALPAEAVRAAASAGTDEDDRQQLVLAIVEHEISGLEMIVGPDRTVLRLNVYSPDSAMGLMLLEKGTFDATGFDAQSIAGKVFSANPVQDGRIRKTIQYDATFSAPVQRAGAG